MSNKRSMITKLGLNKINESRPNGMSIELLYYVPIYDNRIVNYSDIDISDVSDYEDLCPVGDVYWNGNFSEKEYSITQNNDIITINNIDEHIPEDKNNPTYNSLYQGITYNNSTYSITVSISKGTIRFNKLGIYAVMKSEDGLLASNPFLFAQIITSDLIEIKENIFGSSDAYVSNFTIDFPIDFSVIDKKFNDGEFSEKDNYWEDVVFETNKIGLQYDGTVYASNSLGLEDRSVNLPQKSTDVGVSKFLSSSYKYINNEKEDIEKCISQLTLQYITETNDRNRTDFKIIKLEDKYHLEINMTRVCVSSNDYSIIPTLPYIFSLGKPKQKWKSINLSGKIELLNYDELSDDDFYFNSNVDDKTTVINNGSIYCGSFTYFHGNISSYEKNGIYHDLLIRSFKSIGIINTKKTTTDAMNVLKEINNIDNIINENSIYFISKNINTFGNILPVNNDSVGDIENKFNNIYIRRFFGNEDNNLHIYGNLIAGIEKDTQGQTQENNMIGFNNVFCRKLGNEQNQMISAYSKNINFNDVRLDNITPRTANTIPLDISFVNKLKITNDSFIPIFGNTQYKIGQKEDKRIEKIFVDEMYVYNDLKYGDLIHDGVLTYTRPDITLFDIDADRPITEQLIQLSRINHISHNKKEYSNMQGKIENLKLGFNNKTGEYFLSCRIVQYTRWETSRLSFDGYWYTSDRFELNKINRINNILNITFDDNIDNWRNNISSNLWRVGREDTPNIGLEVGVTMDNNNIDLTGVVHPDIKDSSGRNRLWFDNNGNSIRTFWYLTDIPINPDVNLDNWELTSVTL